MLHKTNAQRITTLTNLPTAYQCPVCTLPLNLHDQVWRCDQNHCFDRHKKGYVNLLLVNQKRSKQPGDDARMVSSRREFLNSGHYAPVAEHLIEQCRRHLPSTATIWDAGCGEGYYTGHIANAMAGAQVYGLDISKPAIEAASSYKNIHWCVASSSHPPYSDQQFDAIISVFSRVDEQPFKRVLKSGGQVFMVVPDTQHLMKLREFIYDEVRPYDVEKHLNYFGDGLHLAEQVELQFDLALSSNQQIQQLLAMTPHAHRLPNTIRDQINNLQSLNDRACFRVYRFVKQG